jgi:hypothetical protein
VVSPSETRRAKNMNLYCHTNKSDFVNKKGGEGERSTVHSQLGAIVKQNDYNPLKFSPIVHNKQPFEKDLMNSNSPMKNIMKSPSKNHHKRNMNYEWNKPSLNNHSQLAHLISDQ